MANSANHFESFEPHTLLKHAVLRAYIERWSRILLVGGGRTRQRVRIVDGCAGAGQDESGNPGSPLIAIQEAEKARGQLTDFRDAPSDIQIVAIEANRNRFKQLKARIDEFQGDIARSTALLRIISENSSRISGPFRRCSLSIRLGWTHCEQRS